MMSIEILKQRRAEILCKTELNRLKKVLRAERNKLTAPRWASAVTWELARTIGLPRDFFEASKNAD